MNSVFFNNQNHKNSKLNLIFFSFFLILQFLLYNIQAKGQNTNNNIYQVPQPSNKPAPSVPKANYAPIPTANPQNPTPQPTYNPTTSVAPVAPAINNSTNNGTKPVIQAEIKNLPKNDYFGPKIGKPKAQKKIIKKIPKLPKNNDSKNINYPDLDPLKRPNKDNKKIDSYYPEENPKNQLRYDNKPTKKNLEIESKKYDINPDSYYYRDEKNAKWLSYENENIPEEKFIITDKNPIQDDFNKKYNDDLIIDNSKNNNQPIIDKINEKVNNYQIKFGLENLNGEYIYNYYNKSKLTNTSKNQIKNLLMSKIELENHFFSRFLRTDLSFSKSLNSANKSKFYQYSNTNPENPQQVTNKNFSTTSNNYKEFNFLSSLQIFQDYIRFNLGYKYNQLIFDESNFQTISSSNINNGNILDQITNINPIKKNLNFNTKYKIPFVGLEIKFPIIAKISNLKISSAYSNRASIVNRLVDRNSNTTHNANFKNAKYLNFGLELENTISKNLTINLNYNFQNINLTKSKAKLILELPKNNGISSKFSSYGINLGYKF